jgi:hypothetical protein
MRATSNFGKVVGIYTRLWPTGELIAQLGVSLSSFPLSRPLKLFGGVLRISPRHSFLFGFLRSGTGATQPQRTSSCMKYISLPKNQFTLQNSVFPGARIIKSNIVQELA